MVSSQLHTPSWRQGFARYRHRSAFPGLWDGLAGAWLPALGPTGLTLPNTSGGGNHGILTGMDAATDWVPGDPIGGGYALDFDGVNDWVDLGRLSCAREQLTVWMHCRQDSGCPTTPFRRMAAEDDNSNRNWQWMCLNPVTSHRFDAWVGGVQTQKTITGIPLDQWASIVVVYDGAGLGAFVDGVEVGTPTAATGAIDSDPVNTSLGARSGALNPWKGRIAAAGIWGRALIRDEIRALYRDPLVLVRRRATVWPAVTALPTMSEPYVIAAGATYVTGSRAGIPYVNGSATGDAYCTGSVAGALN